MDKKLQRAGFKEDNFHTGEVTLNYVAGPPSRKGPPLVFIHGQTVTWEEYTFIMPILSSDFTIYAVTLRGHGKHACPGRFLVDFELKMIIAYVLMNYDVEFPPEYKGKRPQNHWLTDACFPPEDVRIRVRRKERAG
ncbi:hypothetical protein O1611_g1406 [Lasiodiplodia mahajangana]|uniref:Uncharacterized protein n=1 Tax=Lasiodiplodia mahajangana TaxID=1108764 RepID=A0ACC2JY10_9PEZI|nr:hypothetical protein O1611_g1406 [Lasiodiplodia mahajangana]